VKRDDTTLRGNAGLIDNSPFWQDYYGKGNGNDLSGSYADQG